MNFAETYSLVTKLASVLVVLTFFVFFDWLVLQFDVFNTFLHGTLEDVFIEQPRGFIDPIYIEHVCCLKKVLHDLK